MILPFKHIGFFWTGRRPMEPGYISCPNPAGTFFHVVQSYPFNPSSLPITPPNPITDRPLTKSAGKRKKSKKIKIQKK